MPTLYSRSRSRYPMELCGRLGEERPLEAGEEPVGDDCPVEEADRLHNLRWRLFLPRPLKSVPLSPSSSESSSLVRLEPTLPILRLNPELSFLPTRIRFPKHATNSSPFLSHITWETPQAFRDASASNFSIRARACLYSLSPLARFFSSSKVILTLVVPRQMSNQLSKSATSGLPIPLCQCCIVAILFV